MTPSFVRTLYYGVLLAVPVCLIGVVLLFWQPQARDIGHLMQSANAADRLDRLDGAGAAKKRWVCPMHSQILQDHAGSCPICGMDLVEGDSTHEHGAVGVHVDTALQQKLGMRLAVVAPQILRREVQTYGNVGIDETSIHSVSPKVEGWIRKLHVTAAGQRVRAGQLLYEIYSPELVQRQREYIELLQRRDRMLESMTSESMAELPGQSAQVAASLARERIRTREKFAYADVGDKTLAEIERTRRTVDLVPVYAPRSGFVTQIGTREGAYVTPMSNLLSLADTATVWIDFALFPDQLAWVREGDEVTVKLPYSDQPPLGGRLTFASPTVDAASRTARGRLTLSNADHQLRPGAFVDVTIATRPRTALVVPRSAVIRTGNGDRVMLARDGGHFMPVPVETGIESGDFIEITEGLQEGAQVAVSGQFLLDAAASLSDAAQRMQSSR
jgi:Cu(I)/Ag(I) efflux system membrane fusion protein